MGFKNINEHSWHRTILYIPEIGDGSFIGFGSVILPNVRIGVQVVIGANSVVTADIPDYSVAAGSPAIVLKRYDWEKQAWVSTAPHAASRTDGS